MFIVDTHCHAGLNWFEPVESILYQMNLNDVQKAILVQHRGSYDNNYLLECRERFPDRFEVIVMVDTSKLSAPETLARWASSGASGVRLTPLVRSPGSDPLRIWKKAADLGMVVSVLGTLGEFASKEFAFVVANNPRLMLIMEHLGGADLVEPPPFDSYKKVLELSNYPNVFIKVGGLGEITPRPQIFAQHYSIGSPPPFIEMALSSFGANRMVWGSDFPPVSGREGYRNALHGLIDYLDLRSVSDKEWIMGETARTLFNFV